jgi:hypothetical protein
MIALRVVGVLFGLLVLGLGLWRWQTGKSPRLDFLLSILVGLSGILLGIYPQAFTPIFDTLNFRREDNRQLLGVLVISSSLLFLLYFRASAAVTAANRQICQLTQRLAQRELAREAPTPSPAPDVVVVIAAYNEADSVSEVLEEVPSEVQGLIVQPLVVIDGATDHTEEEVRKHGVPVVHAINLGQGSALLTGYQVAAQWGAKIIVAMDADGQPVPGELPRLLQPIIDDEADLVHGSRFLGKHDDYSRVRLLAVKAISIILSLLLRKRVTDFATPFKAFRANVPSKLRLHQVQFQAAEVLIEAARHDLRFKEVPITMRGRKTGKSKKPSLPRYGLGIARAIIQTWLR